MEGYLLSHLSGLYRYGVHNKWHEVNMSLEDEEKFTDIASHGDTLVVLSRSFVYTSLPPYMEKPH